MKRLLLLFNYLALALGTCITYSAVYDPATVVRSVELPKPPSFRRADLFIAPHDPSLRTVLVICSADPAGSAQAALTEPAWIAFTKTNHVGLSAISFERTTRQDTVGEAAAYRTVAEGAIKALKAEFGNSDELAFVLYGYAGGSSLLQAIAAANPSRVRCWCADSPSSASELTKATLPGTPAIIAARTGDPGAYQLALKFHGRTALRKAVDLAEPPRGARGQKTHHASFGSGRVYT